MKQCHKQHAECVKCPSMVEHLDFTSLRHLWRVADPFGRLLGWHLWGQCPRLGQVSEPTCQLYTPVKFTKLWTEPGSTHASLSPIQLGIRRIKGSKHQKNQKKVISQTFYLVHEKFVFFFCLFFSEKVTKPNLISVSLCVHVPFAWTSKNTPSTWRI